MAVEREREGAPEPSPAREQKAGALLRNLLLLLAVPLLLVAALYYAVHVIGLA